MTKFLEFFVLVLCITSICAQRRLRERFNRRFGLNNPQQQQRPQITLGRTQQERTLIKGVQELGHDLSFNQWERGDLGNVVMSPINIASLMGLLLLASRGDSHLEIKRAMDIPSNMTDPEIHQAYKNIINYLENVSDDGIELSMGSRLFLQTGLPVLGEFTKLAEDTYKSKVRGTDFAGSPNEAKDLINKWVEQSTRGHIKNLIERPFSQNTKFVATNVIYFSGDWETQFNEMLTENGKFFTGTGNITVPMMINLMSVPYLSHPNLTFDMISLPYKGRKFSMLILTPKIYSGVQSLQTIEFYLNHDSLNSLVNLMKPQRLTVKLPRMKLSNKMFLKNSFRDLGASTIFDQQKADFGRLTNQPGIFVDNIVHEAILEITETGTKAAAATSASFDRLGSNTHFHVDRPSLIYIRDNTNGLILFSARLMVPDPI